MKRIPIQVRIPIILDKQDCCPYEEPYGYIYKITNKINGHYYIGKHEFHEPHMDKNYFTGGKLLNMMLDSGKYSKDDFEHTIIDWINTDLDDLNKAEKYWIYIFGSFLFPQHYNLTEGGDGYSEEYWTYERRKERSEMYLGENNPNYGNGQKISGINNNFYGVHRFGKNNPFYGHNHTEESKEKNRQSHLGKKMSEDTRRKMSENHYDNSGVNHPLFGIYGKDAPRSIPVVQLTLDGEFVRKYDCIKDSKQFGFPNGGKEINKCCKGIITKYKGFKWMYLKDYERLGGLYGKIDKKSNKANSKDYQ